MLIAIDGACKRNGMPDCVSAGVSWIQTNDGDMLFKTKFETSSTSQRGEINGLLEALRYAVENTKSDEDIIIITDSEYLYNTVALDWVGKWANNNWVGATGTVKNADMWATVYGLLQRINKPAERVYMQWTKGHLISYSTGNITRAMAQDPQGLELYASILCLANREFERTRIVKDFLYERRIHDKLEVPDATALEWVIINTVADCLASYVVRIMDNAIK